MQSKKLIPAEMIQLVGYALPNKDSFHVHGANEGVTALELLKRINTDSYEQFIDLLADYLITHLKAGTKPEFMTWCQGQCCRSLLTHLVIKCESESKMRLTTALINKLKESIITYELDLVQMYMELFRGGPKIGEFKVTGLHKSADFYRTDIK